MTGLLFRLTEVASCRQSSSFSFIKRWRHQTTRSTENMGKTCRIKLWKCTINLSQKSISGVGDTVFYHKSNRNKVEHQNFLVKRSSKGIWRSRVSIRWTKRTKRYRRLKKTKTSKTLLMILQQLWAKKMASDIEPFSNAGWKVQETTPDI